MSQPIFPLWRLTLRAISAGCLAFTAVSAAWSQEVSTFQALLQGPQRSTANVVRDPHRHPAETLAFFGIQAQHTVVEILPGSGGGAPGGEYLLHNSQPEIQFHLTGMES